MNAGNYKFKLTWSSLWHLWQGGTPFRAALSISILRVVLLLDVSKWQGLINFTTMLLGGVKGVIIKCGQGMLQDLKFSTNWLKAKSAGVPRGSYWFYDSRVAPKVQAGLWWDWIKADRGELMHFADYEENYMGAYKGWVHFKIFLQEFQRISGLPSSRIGIYTGYYYWIAHSPANLADLAWFAQFALWLAWYTSNPADVIIPRPWTSLILWQYGTPTNGLKYGAESLEIDENNFNGDEKAYRERFGLPDPGSVALPPIEPIPPEPEPGLWNAAVLVNGLYVRKYPVVVDGTKITIGEKPLQVNAGEKFAGRLWVGNGYVWMKIDQSALPELAGRWVAVRSESGITKFISLVRAPSSEQPTVPPVTGPQLWQVKHDIELGGIWRPGLPEVHRLEPFHHVVLTEAIQWLWRRMNPTMTGVKWSKLLGNKLAFTNGSGFPGHANYILREELEKDDPRFDQARICGGATVAEISHDSQYVYIQTIDATGQIPQMGWVLERPWLYFHAVTVRSDGSIGMFPQGEGQPVLVPLLSSQPVKIPILKLKKLPLGAQVPSPYR